MIEFLIFILVLGFIAILFYKQANEEFEILQIDAERIQDLPTLYPDRSPIVVRDFPVPALGTIEEIRKRKHILTMAVIHQKGQGQLTLQQFLDTPAHILSPKTAEFLSNEAGLHVWFEHSVFKQLLPSPWTSWLYTCKTRLWPHHRGMYKTTAFQTMFMPTQGSVRVSLLLPKMLPFLPTAWEGRQFHSLTAHDTPLLSQIKFMEIKLRKGNVLLLPAHILVDVDAAADTSHIPWIFQAEIHHPISRMASM